MKILNDFFNMEVPNNKPMCWCGCFQTHQLKYCNHCGQEFKKFSSLTMHEYIKIYSNHYKLYNAKNPLENSLRWFYAIYKRVYFPDVSYKIFNQSFKEHERSTKGGMK